MTPPRPQLTGTPTTPTLWNRTVAAALTLRGPRTVSAYPLRTEPVIGTPREVRTALSNPAVHSHGPVTRLRDGRVKVTATYVDYANPHRSPARYRLTADHPAAAATTRFVGILTGTITAGYGLGQIVWLAWGEEITAAAKLLGIIGGVGALVAAAVAWFLSHGRNGCTGIHGSCACGGR